MLGEFLWYLSKDNQLEFIRPYIPAYADDSEDDLTVHGGYGLRIFNQRGHDQLDNIINQLRQSPTSRRAVVQIFDAEDIAKRYKEVRIRPARAAGIRSGGLVAQSRTRLPVPGQEFIDLVGRMRGDSGEHIGEPGLRIHVVQLCSDDQRIHRRSTRPTTV
jgi:hypothetical protein